MDKDTFVNWLAAAAIVLCAAGFGFLTDAAIRTTYENQPRLVGHGCIGASGPLYANEEDEFPPCLVIEERD